MPSGAVAHGTLHMVASAHGVVMTQCNWKQGAAGSHSMRSAKKIHAFIDVVSCLWLCGDVNGRGSRRSSSCAH